MRSFIAPQDGPLLECLLALETGLARTRLKTLLKHGAVRVNGKAASRHDDPVRAGDRIELAGAGDRARVPGGGLRVVHEDEDVVVVDKPSGLLTVATEKEKERTAYRYMNEWLAGRGRAFVVHRLDRDTSGLVVFAKSEEAKRCLQEEWSGTQKRYWAAVAGVPAEKKGRLESDLAENEAYRVYEGSRGGEEKRAVTRYEVVKAARRTALLDVAIETGRKHQIRVHLASIGHPVLGDRVYGGPEAGKGRLALHARLLAFTHPATGERLTFESPLPPEIAALV